MLEWQGERERAALSRHAFYPDPPAVKLDEPLSECQPEAGALARPLAPGLPEFLEDALLVLAGDADAGIAHLDANVAAFGAHADADATAVRRELHRVA